MNYFFSIKEGNDFEKKHTSFIYNPDKVKYNEYFEVKISTGMHHSIEDGPFIHWIELFIDIN